MTIQPALTSALLLTITLGCAPESNAHEDFRGLDTDTGTTDVGSDDATDDGAYWDSFGETAWNVYNSSDQVIGWLATPDQSAFADHEDIFSTVVPRNAYMYREDGYGLMLTSSGYLWLPVPHAVRFTGPNCTGTPLGIFATKTDDPSEGVPAALCTPAGIESMDGKLDIHYGLHDDTAAWVEATWPNAPGIVVQHFFDSTFATYYDLPTANQWPVPAFARSQRLANGACEEFGAEEFVCAVEFEESGWQPLPATPPFSLSQG